MGSTLGSSVDRNTSTLTASCLWDSRWYVQLRPLRHLGVDIPPAQSRDLRGHQPHIEAEICGHLARLHIFIQVSFDKIALLFSKHWHLSLIDPQLPEGKHAKRNTFQQWADDLSAHFQSSCWFLRRWHSKNLKVNMLSEMAPIYYKKVILSLWYLKYNFTMFQHKTQYVDRLECGNICN